MVIWLISAELLIIRAICIWCTVVHALTFVLFMLVVTGWEDATAVSGPWIIDGRLSLGAAPEVE